MSGVVPLADRDRRTATPAAAPAAAGPRRPGFVVDQDEAGVAGRAPGVNKVLLESLQAGRFPPAARFDLHGRRAADVAATLARFLASARADGPRCVAVVHGRGSHAADGTASLRDAVIACQSRPLPGEPVLAFATAPAQGGGDGATWVLLREVAR
jgi:DNA-nicking Smr family endonuclease